MSSGSKARALSQPVETEDGERLLVGTRRPDGTIRKDRRIRPGYTPQEEQPLYQSKGVLARQNVPVCPGLDPAMLAGAGRRRHADVKQAKSKSQKKNEKRKEKKEGSGSKEAEAVEDLTSPLAAQMQQLGLPGPGNGAPPAAAPAAQQASAIAAPGDEAAVAEKALRALRKKVRQAEQLAEKRAGGAALSAEETEKLGRLDGWLAEAAELEARLAQLAK